ncbi:hypothetical protein PLESTF_000477300 [Pleodorina starrii]|nr:hypothetical protein PLESTF_000477300 [Pleodorina starrii]
MATQIKEVLLKLERCRDRLAALAHRAQESGHTSDSGHACADESPRACGQGQNDQDAQGVAASSQAAGPIQIRLHLMDARRKAKGAASMLIKPDAHLRNHQLLSSADGAASSLALVVDALGESGIPALGPEAVQARFLLIALSEALVTFQQRQVAVAANTCAGALAAGDTDLAASAALFAEEAAATAMWAACLGGLHLIQEVRAAQRTATAMADLALPYTKAPVAPTVARTPNSIPATTDTPTCASCRPPSPAHQPHRPERPEGDPVPMLGDAQPAASQSSCETLQQAKDGSAVMPAPSAAAVLTACCAEPSQPPAVAPASFTATAAEQVVTASPRTTSAPGFGAEASSSDLANCATGLTTDPAPLAHASEAAAGVAATTASATTTEPCPAVDAAAAAAAAAASAPCPRTSCNTEEARGEAPTAPLHDPPAAAALPSWGPQAGSAPPPAAACASSAGPKALLRGLAESDRQADGGGRHAAGGGGPAAGGSSGGSSAGGGNAGSGGGGEEQVEPNIGGSAGSGGGGEDQVEPNIGGSAGGGGSGEEQVEPNIGGSAGSCGGGEEQVEPNIGGSAGSGGGGEEQVEPNIGGRDPPCESGPGPSADAWGEGQNLNDVLYLMELSDFMGANEGRLPQCLNLRRLHSAASAAADLVAANHALKRSPWGCTLWDGLFVNCGVVQLLSHAVRQLREVVAAGAGAQGLAPWCKVLRFACCCLRTFHLHLTGCMPQERTAEVLRLLARTDLAPCLSRLFAATAQAAVGGGATAVAPPPTSAAPVGTEFSGGGGSRNSNGGDGDGLDLIFVFHWACTLLENLMLLAWSYGSLDEAHVLRAEMQKSGLLEHCVRAAALLGSRSMHNDGAGCSSSSTGSSGLESPLFAVMRMLESYSPIGSALWSPVTDESPNLWVDALAAGPCVQRFLLLHAVSQLCAADGGPDYGLPPGARLPPFPIQMDLALMDVGGKVQAVGVTAAADSGAALSPNLMIWSFLQWTHNGCARPCSVQALRLVCERAAAAASASWQAYSDGAESATVAGPAAAAAAAAAGSATAVARADATGAGGSLRGRKFGPPESALSLGLAALNCAVALTRGGAAAYMHKLWAPVVRYANAVQDAANALLDGPHPLQLLVALPLPPLRPQLTDSGALSPQAGPDLAAALAAGYVPALERALRDVPRRTRLSGDRMTTLLASLSALARNLPGLASLMAYGDPLAVASLLATSAKLLVVASNAEDAATMSGLVDILANLVCLSPLLKDWDGGGSAPTDEHWWLQYSIGSGAGQPPPPPSSSSQRSRSQKQRAAGGPAARRGNGGGAGAAVTASGSNGDAAGGSPSPAFPPLQQLSLLGCFAAKRLLSVLVHLLGTWRCPAVVGVVVCWLPPLIHAYLQSSAAAAAATATPGRAGSAAGSSHRDGATAAAASVAAAASWERLLLGCVDVPRLLGLLSGTAFLESMFPSFITAFLHLIIAFPRQGGAVLRARVSQGGSSSTVLAWLLERCAKDRATATAAAAATSTSAVVRHFLELAPAVAAGRTPTQEDVQRLRSEAECGWAARLGALLPPPCFVAAALKVPLCANPGCLNLDGECEGAMRLTPCKGCGGAVAYCCRACEMAHWRAGHKTECGGGGKGRGRGEGAG